MKLIHKGTKKPVDIDDAVRTNDGDTGIVEYFREPRTAASSGKITIAWDAGFTSEVYVSVVNCEWIDREDHQ